MSPFQITLNLGQRVHTTRGRTLRGRRGFVPILPKRGLVVPKVFTPKIPSPVPKGDGRMEAIKSLKSLYQHWFGSKAQEKPFGTLRPLEHKKSRKYG